MRSLRGSAVSYARDPQTGYFWAKDGDRRVLFSRLFRGFWLYDNGFDRRATDIAQSYLLDAIQFTTDDIVIDCGANYGDLYLYLSKFIRPESYHAFEPGIEEFDCLTENASGSNLNKMALSSSSGEIEFYQSPEGGDGSAVEPSSYLTKITSQSITLDDYMARNSISKVKLLKLEAEGFEPEILRGTTNSLDQIEFIAVDGGRERGVGSTQTLSLVANYLIKNGFEMMDIDLERGWGRALFQRVPAQID